MQAHRSAVFGCFSLGGEGDVLGIVEVPIALGGDPVEVGPAEAESEEEGFVGIGLDQIVQGGDREVGIEAVDVCVVGDIGAFVGRAIAEPAAGFGCVVRGSVGLVGGGDSAVFGERVAALCGGAFEGEFVVGGLTAPRQLEVVELAVVNFAGVDGFVAFCDQVLGQGDDVGIGVAEISVVFDDVDRIGASTGHEARARRTANRLLAVGAAKLQTVIRECIEVGCHRQVGTVAADFRPQIIDGDEEDVGFRCR